MFSLLLAMLVPLALGGSPSGPRGGGFGDLRARQVRIEERIIVRIPPGSGRRPRPQPAVEPTWQERKVGRCLRLGAIGSVRIEGEDSLLLFMHDRRVIRAGLDRACSAREFYSGFYVERAGDGMLCAGRDLMLSRSGATCSLTRLRLLVPAKH